MDILVVGSGGREHALCWAIAASPLCNKLLCAPGNPGIAAIAECCPVATDDIDGLVALARERSVELVVVGPEAPLCLGLVDRLDKAGIKAFGPSAAAARLEGSKGFMKDLCARHDIPTAGYSRHSDIESAREEIRRRGAPLVVKADGLAAGKGVTIAQTVAEAEEVAADALIKNRFGEAGSEVVLEEFLEGEEVSVFALCDGAVALTMASAQDHKAAYNGDKGPNTGGMGAYSPAPVLTKTLQRIVEETIITPTVEAMQAEGYPYKGVLYAGLMITAEGPKLLEYNARFGDPECQVLMLRLMSDILPALIASADGQLGAFDLRWREDPALVVVLAAEGYPGDYETGTAIAGLEVASNAEDGIELFHAGTKMGKDGQLVAAGGRVLNVAASAPSLREAHRRAYAAVDRIDWPQGFCRRDIGWRALERE